MKRRNLVSALLHVVYTMLSTKYSHENSLRDTFSDILAGETP